MANNPFVNEKEVMFWLSGVMHYPPNWEILQKK